MKRQQILTAGLILTAVICVALGVADHLLTQQIQESEDGLYQDGVRIEKVEGADSESDEPETTGSEI